ncbi:MAG: class flavin-dependent oxidoreductase [Acidimicrobiia bacterium]|nr:class flavin-dependent oxidoreductase [Acidimicrobiia bacterium]
MSATSGIRPVEFATTGFCQAFQGPEVARRSEELGFDVQMFGENHAMAPDVFGEIRDAARATDRIRLLCGPVNFVTRDPGVIASAIAPIQILTGGRAICGVARGDSAVAMAGKKPQRQQAFDDDLVRLRAYLDGQSVPFPERVSRLEWIGELPFSPVPIEMVCSGPRAIELAARVADRIGLSVGYSPERVGWALDIIAETLDRVGRPRADVRVGLFGPLAITEDRASGPSSLKTRSAAWVHMSSFRGNDLNEQPEAMRKVTSVLRDGYDYRFHRADAPADNSNNAAIDEDFADWYGVGGPPAYVIDRFGALIELGVDYFSVVIPEPEREIFASDVMPALRRLR